MKKLIAILCIAMFAGSALAAGGASSGAGGAGGGGGGAVSGGAIAVGVAGLTAILGLGTSSTSH